MTPTSHDALFKAAFEQPEHAGQMFRGVLPEPIVAAIEWDTIAMEPGSFIDPALGGDPLPLIIPMVVSHAPGGWTAAFPKLALWALRDARDIDQLLANLGQIAAVAAEASQTPSGMDALAQVFRYIALVSKELKIEDFRAKIREQLPEAEDSVMTIYEQALAEGREEGRIDILVKLLTLKFGKVSSEDQARLRVATLEELDRYAERVLTADSLAAVFVD